MSSARRARRLKLLGLEPSPIKPIPVPILAGDVEAEPSPISPSSPCSTSSMSSWSEPEIRIIVSGNDATWDEPIEPVVKEPEPQPRVNFAPSNFARPTSMPKEGRALYKPAPTQPAFNFGLTVDTWRFYAASVISRSNIQA